MRLAVLLSILAIVSIAASMNVPTFASIPPGLHTSVPEPTVATKCGEYLAQHPTDRMDDWLDTFQKGLMSNPELAKDVWDCVMDTYRVSETDQFMLRLCKAESNVPFTDLAFKALVAHLAQCEISVTR